MTGILDEWCAWHERWEMAFGCHHCDARFPLCYATVHLQYACPGYDAAKTKAAPEEARAKMEAR